MPCGVVHTLDLSRPRIMGILNVTPDSFSDGGAFADEGAAVARGLAMAAQGADIIDVGGESTRPGAEPVPAAEQIRRTVGVIRRLRRELDAAGRLGEVPEGWPGLRRPEADVPRCAAVPEPGHEDLALATRPPSGPGPSPAAGLRPGHEGSAPGARREDPHPASGGPLPQKGEGVIISIDTTLVEVAGTALDAGATLINDVSAGRDPRNCAVGGAAGPPPMFALAAERRTPVILMHMQGTPGTMQQAPTYQDVVAQVLSFLTQRARLALSAGVPEGGVLIDPGIGFGKTLAHNLALLKRLDRFVATGWPVVLGASRKRFMRAICYPQHQEQARGLDLSGGTCATTALGVAAGVAVFRVHDVAANRQAADVAWAIRNG